MFPIRSCVISTGSRLDLAHNFLSRFENRTRRGKMSQIPSRMGMGQDFRDAGCGMIFFFVPKK